VDKRQILFSNCRSPNSAWSMALNILDTQWDSNNISVSLAKVYCRNHKKKPVF